MYTAVTKGTTPSIDKTLPPLNHAVTIVDRRSGGLDLVDGYGGAVVSGIDSAKGYVGTEEGVSYIAAMKDTEVILYRIETGAGPSEIGRFSSTSRRIDDTEVQDQITGKEIKVALLREQVELRSTVSENRHINEFLNCLDNRRIEYIIDHKERGVMVLSPMEELSRKRGHGDINHAYEQIVYWAGEHFSVRFYNPQPEGSK